MESRSPERSRAEILFAELLVEEPRPSADVVQELCAAHPELGPELLRLHGQLLRFETQLPTGAVPGAESPEDDGPPPPDLGPFRCLRLLGRGGMGEVWEAEDSSLGRRVAVKLLREAWSPGDSQSQRFQREAQAAGRVQHPGIVAVHQTGVWQGRSYIVQELVPGGRTLRDEIEELRRQVELPADHARQVARRFAQLADALGAAHAAGVVHRDLKPQNVLLTARGEAKVADFGLARLVHDAALSRTGEFLGTYLYASPEQIAGAASTADERSDVFSLGATLYENLTLERPFGGDSAREVSHAVALVDPPAPHLVRKRIPRDLSLICMKALEKRPANRYEDMPELAADLGRFLAHEPIRARAPSPARRAVKWSQRHPTLTATLGLSFVASAALAALFVRSERLREAALRAQTETLAANKSLLEATEDLRLESASREEVIAFLVGVFARADPEISGDRVPDARELLEGAVQRMTSGEVTDPRVRARLLGCLGAVSSQLAEYAQAKSMLREAMALFEEQEAAQSVEAAEVELSLTSALRCLGETAEADERLARLVARVGSDPVFDERLGARIMVTLGDNHTQDGRYEQGEEARARAEELAWLGPPRPDLLLKIRLDRACSSLLQNRLDEARELLEALVAENRERLARASPSVLLAVNYLGMVLIRQGGLEEAQTLFLELCGDAERSLDADHPTALLFRVNLARVWEAMRRFPEAEELYREILPRQVKRQGPLDASVLTIRNNIGACLFGQGRLEEAEAIYRDLWETLRTHSGEQDRMTLKGQNNLARVLLNLGRADEALELQEGVVALTPPEDPSAAGRRALLENIRARITGD